MYSNYITVAVIDLGSHSIKGALAQKYPDDRFRITHFDQIPTQGAVRRGVIHNLEITAQKVRSLIERLERASGEKILKVYANLGGQSLRTVEHVESLAFETPHEITAQDIDRLMEQVQEYQHDRYEMLQVDSPQYMVNNTRTNHPVGVQALKIDARYKLIVARPELRGSVSSVMEEKLGLGGTKLLIPPLVQGNALLSEDLKNLGCVLIDFGAGTTTVSAFKAGLLRGIRVIPLGGDNITKDLTALKITESEAERIKKEKGCAIAEPGDKVEIAVNTSDNLSVSQLSRFDVNRYIEARTQEIIDNIDNAISTIIRPDEIGGGIVATGGGSEMNGLLEKLVKKLSRPVEVAASLLAYDLDNQEYIKDPTKQLLYCMVEHASEECTAVLAPSPARDPSLVDPFVSAPEEELGPALTEYPEDSLYQEERTSLFSQDEIPVEEKPSEPKKSRRQNPEVTKKTSSWFREKFKQLTSGGLFPTDEDSI